MQIGYHVQIIFHIFLEMGQRALEGLGSLDPPIQSIAASWPHSCAYSVLCCVISRKHNKDVCLGKVLPYFHMAPSPATPALSHVTLLRTILDWLHSQGLQRCCAG